MPGGEGWLSNVANDGFSWVDKSVTTASASTDIDADTVNVEGKLTVNGIDVGATLKTLQERFLILEADFEKHEQYPALKDAYKKYKLIEKLLQENK